MTKGPGRTREVYARVGPLSAVFFGVPPVTAVAVKTVYVSRREMVDAS